MGVTVTGLGSALGVLTVKNLTLHPSINIIRKAVLIRNGYGPDPSIKEPGLPMVLALGQKNFGNFFNFGNLEQLSLLKRKSYKCVFCYIYHITRCDFFLLIYDN